MAKRSGRNSKRPTNNRRRERERNRINRKIQDRLPLTQKEQRLSSFNVASGAKR